MTCCAVCHHQRGLGVWAGEVTGWLGARAAPRAGTRRGALQRWPQRSHAAATSSCMAAPARCEQSRLSSAPLLTPDPGMAQGSGNRENCINLSQLHLRQLTRPCGRTGVILLMTPA